MTGAASIPDATTEPLGAADAPHRANWSGVLAMSVCVFALVASEFLPVSLLTPIAVELGVTEGAAGQGIAISGAFAVVTSVTIGSLAGRLDRKTVLLGLTLIMAVSGALVAIAPNYLIYMIGRALIGVVIGGFWSLSAATAMRLVPSRQVPRALAIFNGGNALASVLAAPLGSFLGSIVGWRGAFFAIVPIAIIAFVWQAISLPSLAAPERATGPRAILAALRRRPIVLGMLACGLFFMGQFMSFTYIRPFLEAVPQLDVPMISLVLLTIGAAGLVGTALIGRFIDKDLYRTVIVIPIVMAVVAAALIPFGPWAVPVFVLLGIWGLLATAAPVGWWSWIARAMPKDAEAGGGLMVAVIQLAIALGSTMGGVLFDAAGYLGTFAASAVILAAAALVAVATSRAHRAEGF